MFIDFCAGPLHAPRSAEPTHDDLKMPALYGEKKKAKQAAFASTSHVVDAVAGATSQPCADPNELLPAELKRITRGCLEYLGKEGRGDATYVAHLVTANAVSGHGSAPAGAPSAAARELVRQEGRRPWTRSVTVELIGRPINAHGFWGGIVKTVFRTRCR